MVNKDNESFLKIVCANLYIVREKDGYAVLPALEYRVASTAMELSTTKPPRIFTSYGAAASAVRWWKAGIAYRKLDGSISSIPMPKRRVELEIIPIIPNTETQEALLQVESEENLTEHDTLDQLKKRFANPTDNQKQT